MDTICSISTAPGVGGIAVIRISGPGAVFIANSVYKRNGSGSDLLEQPNFSLGFGKIIHEGECIDEALVSVFRSPHSYTGEDTVEINCHGSVYIQQRILQILVDKGCRLASAGEFTKRAFLNGKIDLSQAEAVADLISSSSEGMHRLAMTQMRGGFSRELDKLRVQLLDFASLIELELDFGEEDVEFADRSRLLELSSEIERVIDRLTSSFAVGNVIKNGIPVAIIGATNAGKSTLLNLLLGEERAIVSDIHGTTRDAIEDTVNIAGLTFRFIDTAGIRHTNDAIENLGIDRTFEKISQAAIVLWVIDLSTGHDAIESVVEMLSPHLKDRKTILAFNKSDLAPASLDRHDSCLESIQGERINISAKERTNIDSLKRLLVDAASIPEIRSGDVIVANLRHYEALKHAHESIQNVVEGLKNNLSGDLLSLDIRECLHYIGEISGKISSDEILGNIFSRFCIGK